MPGAGGGGKGCSLKLSSGEASLVRRVLWASSARNGGGGGRGGARGQEVVAPGRGTRPSSEPQWKNIICGISHHASFVSETWKEGKEGPHGSLRWRGTWSQWVL